MRLLHVTDTKRLESILRDGLKPGTYFVSEDWPGVVNYYKETIEDEGLDPVVIEFDTDSLLQLELGLDVGDSQSSPALNEAAMQPDHGGLDEPLTFTLGMSEAQVAQAWEQTDKSWRACIDLMGTCRCMARIPPSELRAIDCELEVVRSWKSP